MGPRRQSPHHGQNWRRSVGGSTPRQNENAIYTSNSPQATRHKITCHVNLDTELHARTRCSLAARVCRGPCFLTPLHVLFTVAILQTLTNCVGNDGVLHVRVPRRRGATRTRLQMLPVFQRCGPPYPSKALTCRYRSPLLALFDLDIERLDDSQRHR